MAWTRDEMAARAARELQSIRAFYPRLRKAGCLCPRLCGCRLLTGGEWPHPHAPQMAAFGGAPTGSGCCLAGVPGNRKGAKSMARRRIRAGTALHEIPQRRSRQMECPGAFGRTDHASVKTKIDGSGFEVDIDLGGTLRT